MKELGAKRDVTVCSFTHEPTDMPTSLLIICVIVAVFGVLAIGTALLSAISERRNPPIGTFMECNGVRLHYIERGNPAAPSLSVEESVVFGHSWGASVALALALYKRGSVRALILASGYYFPTMRLDFWLLSGPALPILGDVLRYTVLHSFPSFYFQEYSANYLRLVLYRQSSSEIFLLRCVCAPNSFGQRRRKVPF